MCQVCRFKIVQRASGYIHLIVLETIHEKWADIAEFEPHRRSDALGFWRSNQEGDMSGENAVIQKCVTLQN